MSQEPSRCEVLLTQMLFRLYGKDVCKSFADRLPLEGAEAVLDFGCGMGAVAYYAARRLPRGSLTCVDVSGRWLAACRKTLRRHANVSFWLGKLYEFPLPGGCFDLAYCHLALHDIPCDDLQRIVPALAGRLKGGGQLVFREPLKEAHKIRWIHALILESGLCLQSSVITDIPIMGNVLENTYGKELFKSERGTLR